MDTPFMNLVEKYSLHVLQTASRNGYEKAVELLLRNGAEH
jgi:hypothetical protein